MVTLARPPPSEDEVLWKRGRRQDNRAAERGGGPGGRRGYRFFADDEDAFDLEEILQVRSRLDAYALLERVRRNKLSSCEQGRPPPSRACIRRCASATPALPTCRPSPGPKMRIPSE